MCLTLEKEGLKQTCIGANGQFIRVVPASGCETLAMLFLFPGLNTSESVRLQREVHCDPAVNLKKTKPTNDHLKCTSVGCYKCFGLGGNAMYHVSAAACLVCVRLFVSLWTVAHQAPLFMGFCRQEYWSELPFPSPGIESTSLASPALASRFFTTALMGKPYSK